MVRENNQPILQQGFSLIEIFVALILLTVAIFGAIQLSSVILKSTDSSISRQNAIILMDDIFGRMRANGTTVYTSTVAADTGIIACSRTTVANDLQSWRRQLDCAIPGATATITKDNTTKLVTVTITWDDRRGQVVPNEVTNQVPNGDDPFSHYSLSLSSSI